MSKNEFITVSKVFNNLKEIKKYYNKESNTYIFKEDNEYIDIVIFNFDLTVDANIDALDIIGWYIQARNIKAGDIKAKNIYAENITATNIDALDIDALDIDACDIRARAIEAENILYHAVCYARYKIKCKSIKGRYKNSTHFVLGAMGGKLEVKEENS